MRRRELRARCQDSIASVLPKTNLDLSALIQAYKLSTKYQKLIYKSRCNYDAHMKRVEKAYGSIPLKSVTSKDLEKWSADCGGHGKHLPMGRAVMTVIRILLRFGVKEFDDKDCARLAVHFPRFQNRKTGARKYINAAQLVPFRAQAHKMGLHSLALAVALLFEAKLGQKQLIGC
jgi:hypothetical protein